MRVAFVEPLPHLRRLFASMVAAAPDVEVVAEPGSADAWIVSLEREPTDGERPWRMPGATVVWTSGSDGATDAAGLSEDAVVVARPFPADALRRALQDAVPVARPVESAEGPTDDPVVHSPAPPTATPGRRTGVSRALATRLMHPAAPAPPPPPVAGKGRPVPPPPPAHAATGEGDSVTGASNRAAPTAGADAPSRFAMALAEAMGVPEAHEVVLEQVQEAQLKAAVRLVDASE